MSRDPSSLGYDIYTLPNGERVFYLDLTHSYFVNGVELPSITTLLSATYGDIYSHVNKDVLAKAAERGTQIHQELQVHIDARIEDRSHVVSGLCFKETENYFNIIEPIWKISPIMTERVVVLYSPDGVPKAAGRFDMLCNVNGIQTLVDFKTTSVLHRREVTAQLNLYLMAAIQSGYIPDFEETSLGVIHLHGDTCKFMPIQRLSSGFYLQFLNKLEV